MDSYYSSSRAPVWTLDKLAHHEQECERRRRELDRILNSQDIISLDDLHTDQPYSNPNPRNWRRWGW